MAAGINKFIIHYYYYCNFLVLGKHRSYVEMWAGDLFRHPSVLCVLINLRCKINVSQLNSLLSFGLASYDYEKEKDYSNVISHSAVGYSTKVCTGWEHITS